MPEIAVLVPCYNEEATVAEVVSSFKSLDPAINVYVYDNNSTDDTVRVAEAAGAIVRHEYRQGKGFVVRTMFREVDADVYLMADGDNAFPAGDLYAMAQDVIDGKADMVIGDRLSGTYFRENKRPLHGGGNRVVRWLINKLFKSDIQDVMTGARAFSRRFVKTYPSQVGGFEIETEMTIHALDKNFLITQRDVTFRERPHGSHSKVETLPDGLRVLKTIFALSKDFRPLPFFGFFAAVLFIIGIVLFAIPMNEYLETGLVKRFPTLMVSIFVMTCALMSFVCGVILDSIRKQTRTFYELELNRFAEQNKK